MQTTDYEFKIDNLRGYSRTYKVVRPVIVRGRKYPPGQLVVLRRHLAQRLIKEKRVVPLLPRRTVDVLKKGLILPERVVILGSGPNGRVGYNKIQTGDCVIALNGAINCPVPITIWAAMDPTLFRQEYFVSAMRKLYEAKLDFSMEAIGKGYVVPVMEYSSVAAHFPWVVCTFQLQRFPIMSMQDVSLQKPGKLRVGCTVAGAIVQLAYLCGVRTVVFCGIDMFGSIYWDNSEHRRPERRDKMWGNAPVLSALLRHYEKLGMDFSTLSETALEVKLYG